jgi:hypothetical protein
MRIGVDFRIRQVSQARYNIMFPDTGHEIVVTGAICPISSLIRPGDSVKVYLNNFQTEATVRPLADWKLLRDTYISSCPDSTVVRQAEFNDRNGIRRKSFLLKLNDSDAYVVAMEPADIKQIIRVDEYDRKARTMLLGNSPATGVFFNSILYTQYHLYHVNSPKVGRKIERACCQVRLKRGAERMMIEIDHALTPALANMQYGDLVTVHDDDNFILDATLEQIPTLGAKVRNGFSRLYRKYFLV